MVRILLLFVYDRKISTFLMKESFLFYPTLLSLPHPWVQMHTYSSQQSAGPNRGVAVTSPAGVEVTNEKPGKKKSKTAANAAVKPDPLDQTCVHPESYGIATR